MEINSIHAMLSENIPRKMNILITIGCKTHPTHKSPSGIRKIPLMAEIRPTSSYSEYTPEKHGNGNPPFEDEFLLNIVIFQCHVSFRGVSRIKFEQGLRMVSWNLNTMPSVSELIGAIPIISWEYDPLMPRVYRFGNCKTLQDYLVGGWNNPSEKYQNWKSSPNRGEHKKSLKPPPSYNNSCHHLIIVHGANLVGICWNVIGLVALNCVCDCFEHVKQQISPWHFCLGTVSNTLQR